MKHDELTYLYKLLRCIWTASVYNRLSNQFDIKLKNATVTIQKNDIIKHLENDSTCINCNKFIKNHKKCQKNCNFCTKKPLIIDNFFQSLNEFLTKSSRYHRPDQHIFYERELKQYFYIHLKEESLEIIQISIIKANEEESNQDRSFFVLDNINNPGRILYSKIQSLAHHNWMGFEILAKDLIDHKLTRDKFSVEINLPSKGLPDFDILGEATKNRKKYGIFAQVKAYNTNQLLSANDIATVHSKCEIRTNKNPYKLFYLTSSDFNDDAYQKYQNVKETKDNLWNIHKICLQIIQTRFNIRLTKELLIIEEKYWTKLYEST